jgi:hypothetical protein
VAQIKQITQQRHVHCEQECQPAGDNKQHDNHIPELVRENGQSGATFCRAKFIAAIAALAGGNFGGIKSTLRIDNEISQHLAGTAGPDFIIIEIEFRFGIGAHAIPPDL